MSRRELQPPRVRLRHRLRLALQSAGVDVTRFPESQPLHYLVRLLKTHSVSCVLDVGASDGEYALALRRFGYRGRIVSFEPLPCAFERAVRAAARDSSWDVLPYALGPSDGAATINVAGNAGRSSSLLRMLDVHRRAQPTSSYVGVQEIEQRTLDGLFGTITGDDDVVYLKIDVQGYERHVLDGARESLDRTNVQGVQLELSLAPLYEDAWLYEEALQWAQAHGFSLLHVIPGFTDQQSGRMLQADGVFFRPSAEW